MNYSNLPPKELDESLKVDLNPTVLGAMKGFFQNRGFDDIASESIAVTIMMQAKHDGYNPLQILDSMKGLTDADISALIAEVLNYNRYKSSSLGFARNIVTNPEVLRHIRP